MHEAQVKSIVWMGSSLEDVRQFPDDVRQSVGYALYAAQRGGKSDIAKPLKGLVKRGGVLEIVADYDRDTYRTVYAVKLGECVYVLHAFQKKSRKGRKMTARNLKLIKSRYAAARLHSETCEKGCGA